MTRFLLQRRKTFRLSDISAEYVPNNKKRDFESMIVLNPTGDETARVASFYVVGKPTKLTHVTASCAELARDSW